MKGEITIKANIDLDSLISKNPKLKEYFQNYVDKNADIESLYNHILLGILNEVMVMVMIDLENTEEIEYSIEHKLIKEEV